MARPERFELPTTKFVAWYSIQLSYGRVVLLHVNFAATIGNRTPHGERAIIPVRRHNVKSRARIRVILGAARAASTAGFCIVRFA